MKKISIVLHQTYLEETIKKLHESGYVEIINIEKEDSKTLELTERVDNPSDAAIYATYELRLTRLIDILRRTRTKPGVISSFLHPELPVQQPITRETAEELFNDIEFLLDAIEGTILKYEENLKEIRENKEKNIEVKNQLTCLKNFQIGLSELTESPLIVAIAGKTSNLPDIQREIASHDTITIYSHEVHTRKKIEWIVVLIAHISEKEIIERISRDYLTVYSFPLFAGSPKEALATLKQEESTWEEEQKNIHTHLDSYANEHLHRLYALREEIQLERCRKEIIKNFTQTHYTYFIKGWVLEKNENALRQLITATTDGNCIVTIETPSTNPDLPPTYLETPGWATTFKTFIQLFATPKYGEINPTIFMGIFFIIFFGFMLGDAGYGLVILLLSLVGYLKYGKYSPFLKTWGFLGIWLGATTTIFGLLMNSLFGDFIPRFIYHDPTKPIYSMTVAGVHLPLDSLGDPLTILIIALILGLVHLNLGIILGIVQSVKHAQYKKLLTKYFPWIPLQLGGGLLIGVFILKFQISTLLMYGAIILTLVGIILLFIHTGPLGFFGITGYVGDWLSYARLLALGLATSGMALAFNVVSELIPSLIPLVGIIFLPIILIITHTANLAIQALGAGVHSLRLQYVEFFNRFYEGGGKEFAPFQIHRTYTKNEEKE